jgi:predicted ATP-binding protein involved in virulence
VQFVVTTHSAEVLKEIGRKHLRIIKNGKVLDNVPYIKGRDTNSILEDVFEHPERPADYQEKLDSFYRILEGDKTKAEKILAELKEDWGEMDSEIIRATSYLEIY